MDFTKKMLRDDALSDKVIVVTGGGSGLGKAMTKYFMELGAKVAITSRDLEKLKKTAAELENETGGTCLPLQCDVRFYDQVENMLQDFLWVLLLDYLFISYTKKCSIGVMTRCAQKKIIVSTPKNREIF